jgi:hypothetical protein
MTAVDEGKRAVDGASEALGCPGEPKSCANDKQSIIKRKRFLSGVVPA